MKFDVLIIGAGLAGTNLAHTLLAKGKSVVLFDTCSLPKASDAAAGILNPITGKRLVKTWLADSLFPYAAQFYQALEGTLNDTFYHQHSILRAIPKGSALSERFAKRAKDPAFMPYLRGGHWFPPALVQGNPHTPAFEIHHGGHLNISRMLKQSHELFRTKGILNQSEITHDEIEIKSNEVHLRGYCASHLIFCEGAHSAKNPFFDWLPFEPAKGELLDLSIPGLALAQALYQGPKWLLPLGDGLFRLGATYAHDDASSAPTAQGATALLGDLAKMLMPEAFAAIEITKHRAGIRPTTQDRQPFIGRHPDYPNLHIFGGFGSKGASLSPFLAEHFYAHLFAKEPLLPSIDCSRYAPG